MKLTMKKNALKNLSNNRPLDKDLTPNVAGGKPQVETRAACRSIWACTHPQACIPQ
ncbi:MULTISPECIES: hypothetical protein [Pseudoalteromonas]|uniref:Uncharacterized protein n=2 Tax=Pseudoalteromonas TaxID=53246 RepID=V4JAJ0_PSEL2|nr:MULTISPECIES: hypothetical protein [Pseudoalteromonas]ESP92202.1 hypothetical protein PL2TA16_05039 [Pseudoalteromonas luteoviolacea 2ta16]KZN29309.1 hypothetical protein N483_07695 [Pseudoalteromonas luteoviolacea NCIMB 1944]MBQ4835608.1 hypothetical protein [Pseudoalteromonas luteoviolacea]MCG7549359.1 hypothetical protein [Pseudoalteromonas sp. Of7M-16]MDK2594141.1 hypothetical protein [Pseudoalteromonas sp. P94(2023)]